MTMQHQINNRLCAPFIHDVMARFCNQTLDAKQAAQKIGVSRSRLYELRTEYLHAKAEGRLKEWTPGRSGGNRVSDVPKQAGQFLRRAIQEGYNYAFAASEVKRLFGVETSRWSVRRFALAKGLAKEERPIRIPAHTRRWQALHIGELWQLDASPHRWFGPENPAQPLLDMMDDASRLQVGIRLCRRESLADYIFFFEKAFRTHGLPLAIYVDYATFFRSPVDGRLTALGLRLAFYGVSLRFASTPQAKGKVERIHQVWQDRLPAFFRLNGFGPESDMAVVNEALEALALQRNTHEKHREIGATPQAAWDALKARGQSKLRPVPRDAWWPYVWSVWFKKQVGTRGQVHHGDLFFPVQLPEGERVILCDHGGGHYSVIQNMPESPAIFPVVLFTNLPKNAH
jgi:hypothetical protein